MSWIQTYDNKAFELDNPKPGDIDPVTIAVALARKCRFGCHCKVWYSVGDHSLFVESLVQEPELKLAALLHDAHEVYSGFGDVLRPAKMLDPYVSKFLSEHQQNIDVAIAERFNMDPVLFKAPQIKYADNVALATEARDVMGPIPKEWVPLPPPHEVSIVPLSIDDAADLFLFRLNELVTCQN